MFNESAKSDIPAQTLFKIENFLAMEPGSRVDKMVMNDTLVFRGKEGCDICAKTRWG
jgi:hypothetical protein